MNFKVSSLKQTKQVYTCKHRTSTMTLWNKRKTLSRSRIRKSVIKSPRKSKIALRKHSTQLKCLTIFETKRSRRSMTIRGKSRIRSGKMSLVQQSSVTKSKWQMKLTSKSLSIKLHRYPLWKSRIRADLASYSKSLNVPWSQCRKLYELLNSTSSIWSLVIVRSEIWCVVRLASCAKNRSNYQPLQQLRLLRLSRRKHKSLMCRLLMVPLIYPQSSSRLQNKSC